MTTVFEFDSSWTPEAIAKALKMLHTKNMNDWDELYSDSPLIGARTVTLKCFYSPSGFILTIYASFGKGERLPTAESILDAEIAFIKEFGGSRYNYYHANTRNEAVKLAVEEVAHLTHRFRMFAKDLES